MPIRHLMPALLRCSSGERFISHNFRRCIAGILCANATQHTHTSSSCSFQGVSPQIITTGVARCSSSVVMQGFYKGSYVIIFRTRIAGNLFCTATQHTHIPSICFFEKVSSQTKTTGTAHCSSIVVMQRFPAPSNVVVVESPLQLLSRSPLPHIWVCISFRCLPPCKRSLTMVHAIRVLVVFEGDHGHKCLRFLG